jgi:hypothetical protein
MLIMPRRSITMQCMTGWSIGGLLTIALWAPGVGAHTLSQEHAQLRPYWRAIHHDRQALHRDRRALRYAQHQLWRDRRAGHHAAVAAARAALRRAHAALHADVRALHRDPACAPLCPSRLAHRR